jgi:hypothetical protein
MSSAQISRPKWCYPRSHRSFCLLELQIVKSLTNDHLDQRSPQLYAASAPVLPASTPQPIIAHTNCCIIAPLCTRFRDCCRCVYLFIFEWERIRDVISLCWWNAGSSLACLSSLKLSCQRNPFSVKGYPPWP